MNGSDSIEVAQQNVWGEAYANELILRDRNVGGTSSTGDYGVSDSGLNERIYALEDANYGVTALGPENGTGINIRDRLRKTITGQP